MNLLAQTLAARGLGAERFGQLGVIQSTILVSQALAGVGLGIMATRFTAELRVTDPAHAGRVLTLATVTGWVLGLALAVGVFLCAPWLAGGPLAAPDLTSDFRISALLVLLTTVQAVQAGALYGLEAFKTSAALNAVTGGLSLPVLWLGVSCFGLAGAVWALSAIAGVNVVLCSIVLRRSAARARVPMWQRGWTAEWRLLFSFGLPSSLTGVVSVAPVWICNAILVNQWNGYEEMGAFHAANQWRMAILFLPATVSLALLPILVSQRATGTPAKHRKVLLANLAASATPALLISVPVVLLAPQIMHAYGDGFSSAVSVLRLLAICSIPMAACNVVGQAIISEGQMWCGCLLNALWALVLASTFWLLRSQGALGLAIANVCAYALHLCAVSLFSGVRCFEGSLHWWGAPQGNCA